MHRVVCRLKLSVRQYRFHLQETALCVDNYDIVILNLADRTLGTGFRRYVDSGKDFTEAPDILPSVTRATLNPLFCKIPDKASILQLRHPV